MIQYRNVNFYVCLFALFYIATCFFVLFYTDQNFDPLLSYHQAERYRNRKNVYALNIQVICDGNLVICDIVARWWGSVHDARIFDNSSVKLRFDMSEFDGILLGDSGYPLKTYLMTPFLHPADQQPINYNVAYKSTRITVVRCFGIWKRRFPALHYGLRFQPVRSVAIIVAAAVLHNIAKGTWEIDFDDGLQFEVDDLELAEERGGAIAVAARQTIVENHF